MICMTTSRWQPGYVIPDPAQYVWTFPFAHPFPLGNWESCSLGPEERFGPRRLVRTDGLRGESKIQCTFYSILFIYSYLLILVVRTFCVRPIQYRLIGQ